MDKAYQEANVFGKNLTDLMDEVAKQPLFNQPGERWVYSTGISGLSRTSSREVVLPVRY